MSKKLVITEYRTGILTALLENRDVVELQYEDRNQTGILGNIYIGRVEHIVKNINAAFVNFMPGQTGYYSLEDNKNPVFLNPKANNRVLEGDLILVQVSKENMKTKSPTLTSNFNFTGKYAVLTMGNARLSFSGKIKDEGWKQDCREALREFRNDDYGFIIRTNAYEAGIPPLTKEIQELVYLYEKIRRESIHKTALSLIYRAPASYISNIRDVYQEELEEILTDNTELLDEIKNYLSDEPKLLSLLRLYEDSMISLFDLYGLKTVTERALNSRVWMKSGAYLVIEPTEALVVIDVNTGKYVGKRDARDTRFLINLEAAKEIAKQLRLRNLSGIIIVDFINMDSPEEEKALLKAFDTYLKQDPVRTVLSGMTGLGLVELTRKKVKKPFMEQLRGQ